MLLKLIFWLCIVVAGVAAGGDSSVIDHHGHVGHSFNDDTYYYRQSTFCKRDLTTLRLMITVFRHGDKTPDATFRTDIYQEESWQNGFGQLTMQGVERAFEVGRWMRFCYDSFLHKRVGPKRLYVRSTDYDRTLQSAQALLAGAYPPSSSFQTGSAWGETCAVKLGRIWQPYSVHTIPVEYDELLRGHLNCPRYDQLVKSIHKSKTTHAMLQHDAKFLHKLLKKSGAKSKDWLQTISIVQEAVLIEIENGRRPVEWLSHEYDIERLAFYRDLIVALYNENAELVKIVSGQLLHEILEKLHARAYSKSSLEHIIYSGHSASMEGLLASMGVFESLGYHEPPYGSAVIFELHQLKDGSHAVAAYYRNSSIHEPIPLAIPGCEAFVEDSWSSESREHRKKHRSSSSSDSSIGAAEPNEQMMKHFKKIAAQPKALLMHPFKKQRRDSDEKGAKKKSYKRDYYKMLFHGRVSKHKPRKRNVLCRLKDFKRLMAKKSSRNHKANCRAKHEKKKSYSEKSSKSPMSSKSSKSSKSSSGTVVKQEKHKKHKKQVVRKKEKKQKKLPEAKRSLESYEKKMKMRKKMKKPPTKKVHQHKPQERCSASSEKTSGSSVSFDIGRASPV